MTDTDKATTFEFNGEQIEWTKFDAYLMDDWKFIWDEYVQMTPDEIMEVDRFIPGVVMGMVHMSVAKAKPQTRATQIRKAVGALSLVQLMEFFDSVTVEVADEDVPPPIALDDSSHIEPPSAGGGTTSDATGELSPANTPEPGSGPPGSLTSLEEFRQAVLANSPPGSSTAFGN